MVENEGRPALEAAITEIDRQIDNLQRARQALANLLGGAVPPSSSNPSLQPSHTSTVAEPLALVREQEFHGMSRAEAAQVFLKRTGAQKTGTILQALQKGGVEYHGKHPETALYTALARHSAFVSLKKNWWDLAERRLDLAEEQRQVKRQLRVPKKRRTTKAKPQGKTREPKQQDQREAVSATVQE